MSLASAINNVVNSALFLEAMRNLNWSRGYSWYVELEDVPNPFQKGGVICLPVTDINFTVVDGQSFTWESTMESLSVPLKRSLTRVSLSMLDDEQATIFTFFERWYNSIYNPYGGVLPVTEACKTLTIYKLKSTRSKIERDYYSYNYLTHTRDLNTKNCREFKVYPEGPFIEDEKINDAPRHYNQSLVIVDQIDADFGDPRIKGGKGSFFGSDPIPGTGGDDSTFLSKLADYI